MNKKVWREDKKLMVIVNTSAHHILTLANGIRPFNDLLKEAFPKTLDIGILNLESLEKINLAAELEDRFLQSSIFCVCMWERGLLKLKVAQHETDKIIVSPLLQSVISGDGEIKIVTTIDNLSKQSGNPVDIYVAFNQFRANLVMLLAFDKLLIEFTGTNEDCIEQELVPDTFLPQFRIGYVQPGLILTKPSTGHGGDTRVEPVTALTAITVTTTVTTFAGMIGDSFGRAESR